MKILFIGNSHTYVHYVPLRVTEFCKKQGEDMDTLMLTYLGIGLDWHLEQSQTYFNLIYGKFDAVVFQHNAHPFPGKESLVSAGKALAKLVPETTKIYVYMTWSEKNNPEEEFYFEDGEHSSVLGASFSAAVIGRTLLGMDLTWEACYKDAKEIEDIVQDPRMIDMVMVDGKLEMMPCENI